MDRNRRLSYHEPWPERWERLFGVKPDVVPVADSGGRGYYGAHYHFVRDGKVMSTGQIHKLLPKDPKYHKVKR